MLILFGFLRPDLSPWRYWNRCFLVALCSGVVTFLVVWIFLRSLGVICYGRWVLSVCHKNYFKDWCLMNSQPTFLFLTYINLKFVSAIMVYYFLSNFNFFTKWYSTKNVFYFIWKALFVLVQFFVIFSLPFHNSQIPKEKWKWNNLCYELACINLQM